MATTDGNVGSIRVGAGHLYVAKFDDTRDYSDLTNTLTLTQSADGGTTPAVFQNLGYTQGGSEFTYALETEDITVDQKRGPVLSSVTGITGSFSTMLAEISLRNLQAALAGGDIATNADGSKTFTPPVDETASLALIWLPTDEKEALVLPKLGPNGEVKIGRQKEGNAQLPLSFKLLEADNQQAFYYHADGASAMADDEGILASA